MASTPESGVIDVHIEGSPSTTSGGDKHWMLRVGLDVDRRFLLMLASVPPWSLPSTYQARWVNEDRLGLVQRSLRLRVEELIPAHRVGIVVDGNRDRVTLEPT